MPPKIRNGQHAPSAPYCRFGELGFGKSVIFFRILNTPCRRFIGEGRKIFFIGRHRLSLLAKPAKNANIATIKDISLPPLAFSLSSRFECDNACHILQRFSKKFKKFATLYQKCRIEKIFEICPLTKSFERVRLKMRTAKKEIFCFAPSCETPSASFDFESSAHWYLFIVHLLPAAAPKRGGLVYADVSPCVIALKNSALHTPSGTASRTNGRTSLFASS